MKLRPYRTLTALGLPIALLTQCAPDGCAPAAVATTSTVTHVVDGDTIDISTGQRVRLIGIDTPEAGECGAAEATRQMESLVQDRTVVLTAGARDDVDRYGRLLRYVDVAGTDAGLRQIDLGLAIARYDSRDGYGTHPRQARYVAADAASAPRCSGAPAATVTSPNCAAARAAGAAPLQRGEPGYSPHLDGDADGVACE